MSVFKMYPGQVSPYSIE